MVAFGGIAIVCCTVAIPPLPGAVGEPAAPPPPAAARRRVGRLPYGAGLGHSDNDVVVGVNAVNALASANASRLSPNSKRILRISSSSFFINRTRDSKSGGVGNSLDPCVSTCTSCTRCSLLPSDPRHAGSDDRGSGNVCNIAADDVVM